MTTRQISTPADSFWQIKGLSEATVSSYGHTTSTSIVLSVLRLLGLSFGGATVEIIINAHL
ncbi:MAG: hypothetical protein ABSB81_02845 [Halobacteriota archaeon]